NLKIIKMSNYDRHKYYDELGLLWVLPSPNLPTLSSTITYLGTCIFEGTNISEGRGTTKPFEIIGAPFIDGHLLALKLNSQGIRGVFFRETYFTPTFEKFKNELCGGVQVHIIDRQTYEPVKMGWIMLDVIRNMYPNDFIISPPYKAGMNNMLCLNTGCGYISENKYELSKQMEIIEKDTKEFSAIRKKYLEY
ncbi:MAG: exo-beta-N-acetylmuramidase NamZ domain-containing protein, partial [Bacilli bacterium]